MSNSHWTNSNDEVESLLSKMGKSSLGAADLHKIVVGVDFGTTYTGISYVSTAGSHDKMVGDIHVVRNWPGPANDQAYAWKTPSRIAYKCDNERLNFTNNRWGFDVTAKAKAYSWMKLLLDPDRSTKFDDPSLASSEGQGVLRVPPGKTAVDLCADYLTHIATFAYEELKRKLGDDVVAVSPLEFWFTVPAVWSDRAKAATLRAAHMAATNAQILRSANVSSYLIAEPEAAAVATLSLATQGGSEQQIRPGESVLICDCGGGTVDITTYEVTSIEPRLAFNELLVGTGGKCGSTYVDRLFIAWMEKQFGSSYTNLPWERRGPGSEFMRKFEGYKKDVDGIIDTSRTYELPLVMREERKSQHYDPDSFEVIITDEQMAQFFGPVVNKIVDMVEGQLRDAETKTPAKKIKTVILVGGFGDSRYLSKALHKPCVSRNIRLICPENPQAAIVQGAALSGLHNLQPTIRRARRHYGFELCYPFNPDLHREEHRYFDHWDNIYRARGYIDWKLGKGDIVSKSTHISLDVIRNIGTASADLKFRTEVYSCDLDIAQTLKSDEGVRSLASLETDLTTFDLSNCARKLVNGEMKIQIEYSLQIYFGLKKGVLYFVSMHAGKEAGRTSVTFDGNDSSGNMDQKHYDEADSPTCSIM